MITEALQIPLGIAKAIYGISQTRKGKELLKTPRPEYQIPEGATGALNTSQYLAGLNGLPGQEQIQQSMDANTASALGNMKQSVDNPASILNNVGRLANSQNNQQRQLGIQAAQFKVQNMRNYQQQLNAYAQWQNAANGWNIYQPYQQKMTQGMNLLNAGVTNTFGGANDIAAGIGGVGDMLLAGSTGGLSMLGGSGGGSQASQVAPSFGGANNADGNSMGNFDNFNPMNNPYVY